VVALVAGLAVAVGPGRLRGRTAGIVVPGIGLLAVAVAAVIAWPHLTDIVHSRVSLASGGRRGATGAALHLVAQQPWIGHGPGVAMYAWTDENTGYLARFVHDEYLQTTVDLGAVGAVALLALVAAAARAVWRARRDGPLWIGAAAGLAAFAVHSAFDFLWRPAALPLLAGILLGLAIHGEEEPSIGEENA
jgi:O-antigen ligase